MQYPSVAITVSVGLKSTDAAKYWIQLFRNTQLWQPFRASVLINCNVAVNSGLSLPVKLLTTIEQNVQNFTGPTHDIVEDMVDQLIAVVASQKK
jgi:hypothetical protein